MSDTPRVECAVEDHAEGEYCEYCPAEDPCPCADPGDCDAC